LVLFNFCRTVSMTDLLNFLTLTSLELRQFLHPDLEIVYGWFLNWGWTLSFFTAVAFWLRVTAIRYKGIANLILVLVIILGPLQSWFVGCLWGWVANAFGTYPDGTINWVSLLERPILHLIACLAGLLAGFLIFRQFIPAIYSLLDTCTKSSNQARAVRTDIRTVGEMMPKA